MPKLRFLIPWFAAISVAGFAPAQDGVSTAAAARTRYLSELGMIPPAHEISVEDFVNYHRHEIGRPKAGEAVGLDLRWASDAAGPDGEAVLQVGLSTALNHDRADRRPLNLALVIDKSGSMAGANKLTRVKAALVSLVSQLEPTDDLSIVAFDNSAQLLLPSQPVENRERIKSIIQEIEPGSSTNLEGGLRMGYQEALRHYRREATNRVILLTDGIANVGVTDPKAIAEASQQFNDKGIDLSTIGVGSDLNQEMLSSLAKSGRGLFHFVADSGDIEKVFVSELQSLLSPVATEPTLNIDLGPDMELVKVYGYEPRTEENGLRLKLDNVNSGMTEVVLLRLRSRSGAHHPGEVTVRLSYYDIERKQTVEKTETSRAPRESLTDASPRWDGSVQKNLAIAELAQAIHDMAGECERNRPREADAILRESIDRVQRTYPHHDDEDIRRVLAIAQKYEDILRGRRGTNDYVN